MADTFISYSRKDIAFAKIIHESLQSSDLETWIDWQDIPPSADWFAEIEEAIEKADSFIFIISPTSVESEICSKEIAHAEANHKRLIPIVIDDIDPQSVPSSLIPLNWIFFKEEDEKYAKALQDLVTALTLDQPWVKAHTRLQNRALEWERSGQESGYLLHGADLQSAEAWLSQAVGKDPDPTALQTQYIVASRTQATRRQRRTMTGVLVGMVVAVLLGILAWTQRNVAISESYIRATAQVQAEHAEATAVQESYFRATQQAIAEEQRNIAESKGLAASSLSTKDTDIDLSLLLAIEGLNKQVNYDTKNAMLEALLTKGLLLRTVHLEEEGPIRVLVVNPDLSRVAAIGDGFHIHVFDPLTGALEYPSIDMGDNRVQHIALSPDGNLLAAGASDGKVYTWDAATGEPSGIDFETLEIQVNTIDQIQFVGETTLVGRTEYINRTRIVVWDVDSGDITRVILIDDAHFNDLDGDFAISNDQKLVAITGYQTIYIYELATGELFGEPIASGLGVQTLTFSPDDQTLVGAGFAIKAWDVDTGESVGTTWLHDDRNFVDQVQFLNDDFLLTADDQYIYFWQFSTQDRSAKWAVNGVPETTFTKDNIASGPEGKILIAGEMHGQVSFYGIYKNIPGWVPFSYQDYTLDNALVSPGQDQVVAIASKISADEDLIVRWNLKSGEQLGDPFPLGYEGAKMRFSPDERMVAIFDFGSNKIEFLDPMSWALADNRIEITGDHQISDFLFVPDQGSIIVVTFERELYLFDYLTSALLVGPVVLPGEFYTNPSSLFYDPTGNTVIVHSGFDQLYFYDARSLEPVKDPVPLDLLNNFDPSAISPDGRYLAGISGDLILLDLEKMEIVARIVDLNNSFGSFPVVRFSPDGSILAARYENSFQFFEVPTLAQLGPSINGDFRHISANFSGTDQLLGYDGYYFPSKSIEFSPDGTTVLLGGSRNLRMVEISVEAWIDRACFRAGRNLTPEEWALYLPFDEYQKTCPQYP